MTPSEAAKLFLFELMEYKRNRVQYKQTYKRPIKGKQIINRLKR